MALLSKKLRSFAGPTSSGITFWCPGCEKPHVVYTKHPVGAWQWDGNVDLPTISPSILVYEVPGHSPRCHSFVKVGRIQFLEDCTHDLAGQTVDLPDLPEFLV